MPSPAVRLHDVTYTYPGRTVPALVAVNLQLEPGEIVAVMGPSGAGKTTLAKVIQRTIPNFHGGHLTGSVDILGETMREQGVADLAGRVGLVAQDFESQLFSTNVLQELVFGMEQLGVAPGEMRARAMEALELVGMGGYEPRDPTTLSGGEKQRLAIAATLALDPAILLFDEPTTDLDPAGKEEVLEVLQRMRGRGKTILLVEHETRAAEFSDRLVLLDAGRIVADGPAAEVLGQTELLEAHAVRPPELRTIARRAGLDCVPRNLDEAEAALQPWRVRAEPIAAPIPHDRVPILEIDDVHFAYEDRPPVLRGASLRVYRGDLLAILGRNGSGKSTLAKLMNGLLRPTAGSTRLCGHDMAELGLAETAARVGYVFQNPDLQIFADRVREEVAFGPRNLGLPEAEVASRVGRALHAVGLTAAADEDPFVLAKGERQRLAIASLLALSPEILILDEPTTGLDHREHLGVLSLLRDLHRAGTAIVLITHTPWLVADIAERAVVVADGVIPFDGSVREFLRNTQACDAAHFVPPESSRLSDRLGFSSWNLEGLLDELGPQRERSPCP